MPSFGTPRWMRSECVKVLLLEVGQEQIDRRDGKPARHGLQFPRDAASASWVAVRGKAELLEVVVLCVRAAASRTF